VEEETENRRRDRYRATGGKTMASAKNSISSPKVVSPEEWTVARKTFLAKEKEFARLRDELSRERRELPWEKVEKTYVFEGPKGKESLADLFGGRSQLVVYHFMLGPGWKEGCPGCSFISDTIDGAVVHVAQRDITLLAVSRAPLPEIEAYKKRMGWRFQWVSSFGNDFNFDYHVSFSQDDLAKGAGYYNYVMKKPISEEQPGASVFYKNAAGEIFHTYSTYARGLDPLIGAYHWIDMAPKGRNEAEVKPHAMAWVRHHDRYDSGLVMPGGAKSDS
jgi:predicted dithiol-disulfide oxidoreductase (DUF899 family)